MGLIGVYFFITLPFEEKIFPIYLEQKIFLFLCSHGNLNIIIRGEKGKGDESIKTNKRKSKHTFLTTQVLFELRKQ